MTARLDIEYDGGAFHGWARQPATRTVQGELERALSVLLGGRPVTLVVAGRTDTGVHAWGQVASYAGPAVSVRSLNALLPDDIAVRSCSEAPEGFDARRDATSRAYCYRVLAQPARGALERGRALHWTRPVDVGALNACAAALVGTHDFTAFTPSDTYHVRFSRDVFHASWRGGEADGAGGGRRECGAGPGLGGGGRRECGAGPGLGGGGRRECGAGPGLGGGGPPGSGPAPGVGGARVLEFWIEADTFMRQMNRSLVGTMLQVGSGRRSVEDFVALLAGAPRAAAGPTAPPHGLYLAGVGYRGVRVL